MQARTGRTSADLLSLGEQCSLPECQQTDFLPFTCGACDHVFCLEHRTCAAHRCTKATNADHSIIVCPLCAKAVRLHGQEDPNSAFERHSATDCDPENYARVHKKRRCPVEGCKEKLVSTNTFQCKSCHIEVCLKHRFPADHKCKERAAENAARLKSSQGSRPGGFFGAFRRPPPQEQAKPHDHSVVKEKQQPWKSPAKQAAQPQHQEQPEQCPMCTAVLPDVGALISHVDAVHGGQGQAPNLPSRPQLQTERCPHCQAHFPDAVALVQHVERQHNSQPTCVLS